MASLVLGLAGASAFGAAAGGTATAVGFGLTAGSVGFALGGALGSYIDAMYLFPPKQQDIQGPRLDDVQFQGASEGSPIKFCMGPQNRVAGTVIWLSKLIEESVVVTSGSGKNKAEQTLYNYFVDVAVAVCEGPVNDIRKVFANGRRIYVDGQEDRRYQDITFHLGGNTQAVDSYMQSQLGADVPAYRNIAYVVIRKLSLEDFSNAMPQFTFHVEAQATLSNASAISTLLQRASLVPADFDVTRVPGCLTGYTMSGPLQTARTIEPIMTKEDLTTQEVDGKLVFRPLDNLFATTVATGHVAAHNDGDDIPPQAEFSDVDDMDLPKRSIVSFVDQTKKHQQGASLHTKIDHFNNIVDTVESPLVMLPSEAKKMAVKRLWRAWTERVSITCMLPPYYMDTVEGDEVTLPIDGNLFTIRADKLERGTNYIISVTGPVTHAEVYDVDDDTTDDPEPPEDDPPYDAPDVELVIMDIPALQESQAIQCGYYWALAASDADAEWKGAAILESADNVNFNQTQSVLGENRIFTIATAIPDGPVGWWDRATTVDVVMINGELEGCTEYEQQRGLNTIMVGQELLSFGVATLTGVGTYTLSRLLRGLRGTRQWVEFHMSNETGVLLEAGVGFELKDSGLFEAVVYNKAVGQGGDQLTIDSQSNTMRCVTQKPFGPAHITGSRDGSNNLTIDWVRVSRSFPKLFSTTALPMLEASEDYELVIAGTGLPVTRISVSGAVTYLYTAAAQTSDGLTPGDPVTLRIHQLGAVVGLGYGTEATI